MKDNSITIVIPCYNGWRYMSKCLQSLEDQTVKPDKIIIIDDCSTDESVIKIEEYIRGTELDITLIQNKNNVGPGQSRANSIQYIQTKYVSFCDCDDWYESSFVEDIKRTIISECPDLIIFDNYIVTDTKRIKAGETKLLENKNKNEILALYSMSLWRFVVSMDIIDKVYFPALYNGEDSAVAPQIIALSNKISVLSNAYYNYLYRSNSGSMTISDRVYKDMIEAFRVVQNNISEEYCLECEYIGIKNVLYAASFNALKAGVSRIDIREFLNEFKTEYPNWRYNNYIRFLPKKKKLYLRFIALNVLFIPKIMAELHRIHFNQKG